MSRGRGRAGGDDDFKGDMGSRLWIGGLPRDCSEEDLTREFGKFGKVDDIRLRTAAGSPPYAFVQMADRQDAEDAQSKLDQNSEVFRSTVKVQFSGKAKKKNENDRGGRGGGGRDLRDRSRSRGRGGRGRSRDRRDSRRGGDRRRDERRGGGDRRPPMNAGQYKVTLEGLPEDMSWLELKDLGKQYVDDVTFSRTYRNRDVACGILEVKSRDDVDKIIRKLDGRRIQGCREKMRVLEGADGYRTDRRR